MSSEESKFYKKNWFMWVTLVFVTPVGIFLLWKFHPEFNKNKKVILTIIFALWFFVCLCAPTNEYQSNSSNSKVGSVKTENSNSNDENASELEGQAKELQETSDKIKNLEGKTLTEAVSVMKELGKEYSVINDGNNYDFTEECKSWSQEMSDGWIVKSIYGFDKYTIKITTQEAVKAEKTKETLQSKLDSASALTAVQQYGEKEYPYGFRIVSKVLGNNVEQAIDENTWLLKYSCEITNAFGAEAKKTCEAKVTGTTNSPEVISFSVY